MAAIEALSAAPEQTRARYPDEEGYVQRDGVRVFWERYGAGDPTLLLFATWSIVHSRYWKAQIPYLARHFRVLAFDGRGNGKSDRPDTAEAYSDSEFVADGLAVMDATGTERAVVVTLSMGARWALRLAAETPQRVGALIFLGPSLPLGPVHPERAVYPFDEPLDTDEGWAKENRFYWLRDWRGYLEFFFSQCLNEAHSTKQIEDCVSWGLETTPETMLLIEETSTLTNKDETLALCERVRCPVLVLHGSEDVIVPLERGRILAEATDGTLVTLEGAGHLPQARHPVKVNLLVREFVESLGRRAT